MMVPHHMAELVGNLWQGILVIFQDLDLKDSRWHLVDHS